MENEEYKFDHDLDKSEDEYLKELGEYYQESDKLYEEFGDDPELDYQIEKREAALKEFFGYADDREIHERVMNYKSPYEKDTYELDMEDLDMDLE